MFSLKAAGGPLCGTLVGAGRSNSAWSSSSSGSLSGRGLRTSTRSRSSAQEVIVMQAQDLQWMQTQQLQKCERRAATDGATIEAQANVIERLEAERAGLEAELAATRQALNKAVFDACEGRLELAACKGKLDTAKIRLEMQSDAIARERESKRRASAVKLEAAIADVRASALEEGRTRVSELEAEVAELTQDNQLMRAERVNGMEKRHKMLEELRQLPSRRVSDDVSAMQDGLLQPGTPHAAQAQDEVMAGSDVELHKHQATLGKLNKFGLTVDTAIEPIPDVVAMPTVELADMAAEVLAAAEAAAKQDERNRRGWASPVSLQSFAQAAQAMQASEALSGNGGGGHTVLAALPDDDAFEASLCVSSRQPAAAVEPQLAAPAANAQDAVAVGAQAAGWGWGARWGSDSGVGQETGGYSLF